MGVVDGWAVGRGGTVAVAGGQAVWRVDIGHVHGRLRG